MRLKRMRQMAKGKKTGGRRPGSPNKENKELREMILGALADVGGQQYLVKQAREQPASFLKLISAVLPRDVNIDATVKQCDVTAQAMTAEEWTAQYAADNAALN